MAKEYYAKVEPYELLNVSSTVNAQVVSVRENVEGFQLGKRAYINLDDQIDVEELKRLHQKIDLFKEIAKDNEKLLENYKLIVEKKQKNYDKIKDLSIKSDSEKDREFYDLMGSKNQYIATLKENDNLRASISDLELRQVQLEKSIKDKHLSAQGYVLYQLNVKPGQMVNMGTKLAQLADISKGKLTLFLTATDFKDVKSKTIYIDGQKTTYSIERLWSITDEKHISSYKAVIIIDAPERFSQLVKVEFKSE